MSSPLSNDLPETNSSPNHQPCSQPASCLPAEHIETYAYEDAPWIKVNQVEDISSSDENQNDQSNLQYDWAEPSKKEKKEENLNQTDEKKSSSKEKPVQFQEKLHQNKQQSIKVELPLANDSNNSPEEFQVFVHEIQSSESLSEDGDKRYQDIFTKSEMNIPIAYMGSEEEDEKESKQKLMDLEGEKTQQDEGNDFYVKLLENKWAKRQQQNTGINMLIEGLQTNYQHSKTTQNSIARSQDVDKQKPLLKMTKKTQFKVKKVVDRSTISTTNVKSLNSTLSQLKPSEIFQNQSEVIGSKPNELKTYKHSRDGKKHLSNIEPLYNSVSKHSFGKKQLDQDVQYEISLGDQVEMMSHILEDRCYNKVNHKKSTLISVENQSKAELDNKVRKIIKRSPYGILEIEVKEKRNSAKITNLRILKPKEMIRLKKIPNLVKRNKENLFAQKSESRVLTKQFDCMSPKQTILKQSKLPFLNSNRK